MLQFDSYILFLLQTGNYLSNNNIKSTEKEIQIENYVQLEINQFIYPEFIQVLLLILGVFYCVLIYSNFKSKTIGQ